MLGFVMKSGIFPMYMQKSLFVATNVVEGDQIKRVDIHSRSETKAAVYIHKDSQKVQETIMIVYWPYGAC